ncbi:MAG: peptide chain release factor N(5)-glutamine methyltransferase [Comamonadaceae bacterium]|nr:MAG: peptide chain release factor N(5)-glutamine methyltransferase [Comamonadaceae bacterium]
MTRNLQQALDGARSAGLDRLDAQLLLLRAIGRPDGDRAWLMAHDDERLPADAAVRFDEFVRRRLGNEPVAYLTGRKEFFGLDLAVDRRVLVPRPDTETLVHWSLEVIEMTAMPPNPSVLDLGTGSGAIALAIAHTRQAAGRPASVTAVDASADALAVAHENARTLGLAVQFIQSNWLDGVNGRFDLIASNPPYIASADPHLAALEHEPLQALASGADGLDDIRRIVRDAPRHLAAGGWLLLEHGYDQAAAVRDLLVAGGFSGVQSRCDLAGIERCSGGRWQTAG